MTNTTPTRYSPAAHAMLDHIRRWAIANLTIDGEPVRAQVRIEAVDLDDNRVYARNPIGLTLCLLPEQIEMSEKP